MDKISEKSTTNVAEANSFDLSLASSRVNNESNGDDSSSSGDVVPFRCREDDAMENESVSVKAHKESGDDESLSPWDDEDSCLSGEDEESLLVDSLATESLTDAEDPVKVTSLMLRQAEKINCDRQSSSSNRHRPLRDRGKSAKQRVKIATQIGKIDQLKVFGHHVFRVPEDHCSESATLSLEDGFNVERSISGGIRSIFEAINNNNPDVQSVSKGEKSHGLVFFCRFLNLGGMLGFLEEHVKDYFEVLLKMSRI